MTLPFIAMAQEKKTKVIRTPGSDTQTPQNDTPTPKMQVLTGLTQYDKDFPLIFIVV